MKGRGGRGGKGGKGGGKGEKGGERRGHIEVGEEHFNYL